MRTALLFATLLNALLLIASPLQAKSIQRELRTHAEQTDFIETGRYAESERLCHAFHDQYPDKVRCFSFGTSPEGRALWALAVNAQGWLSPRAATANRMPVTLLQGGIHAGEIDGKDAGFLVLRELLDKPGKNNPLNAQVVLFVPIFNVDGHERFAAWNRPNQRGPKQMGWRTTAQNFNLNRDYLKADSPEMRAMLELVNTWDPLFYVDLHVTDGAKFRHDISVQVDPSNAGDDALRAIGKQYQQAVLADLKAAGSLPLPYYPSFIEYDNPASGFADNVSTPRYSTGYFLLRNRFGVLVETHSWKPYKARVAATAHTIRATLKQVAENGQQWRMEADAADRRSADLAGKPIVLEYRSGPEARTIEFLGYAYSRTPSEVSGALMTRYDETTPAVWRIPLYDNILPKHSETVPAGGYVVPPAFADMVEPMLKRHGVSSRRIRGHNADVAVERFVVSKAEFMAQSFESHQALAVQGQWQAGTAAIAEGSLFVPSQQPKIRLLMAMLEPMAPDSLLAWGYFNNRFERKEYMEDYVAEEVAREMLKNPAIKAEFEARLAADKAFAASPQQRLEFFARKHSSWDANFQAYPVLRTAENFSPY